MDPLNAKKYLCIKNYVMEDGDIAFVKDHTYTCTIDPKWAPWSYMFTDEQNVPGHGLEESDVKEYFVEVPNE